MSDDPSPRGSGARRTPGHLRRKVLRRLRRLAARATGAPVRKLHERVDLTGEPASASFLPERLLRGTEPVPVLRTPAVVPAAQLALGPDELVLGLEMEGDARLYPISTMRRHHIVNDVVGAAPVVVTFCVKCFSGMGFDRVVDHRTLTFDVFGYYQGGMVMKDEQTGTVWDRMAGEGLVGPLAGHHLDLLPVLMARFEDWVRLHPGCLAPDPAEMVAPVPIRPGQVVQDEGLVASVATWDERLPARQLVVGVAANGSACALVVDPDRPGPRLAQVEVGSVPVALLAPPGGWPLAYERGVDGQTLELRLQGDQVVDGAGTLWGHDGRALAGPLVGRRLTFVPSVVSEWFAWAASHPGTEVVRPETPA